MERLRRECQEIIDNAIAAAMPDAAVKAALGRMGLPEKVYLVAIGKAGYQMAKAAHGVLGSRIRAGAVITKYGHSFGDIGPIKAYEAGHPVVDENSVRASEQVLEMVRGLGGDDVVIFLVSGGGSALFEAPLVGLDELQDINRQMLASGADIVEMNTVRKRLSGVKGGKFATACAPARVISIILSDIVGDPLDMIASGPAYPDSSTCADALNIVRKYNLKLSDRAAGLLNVETPKHLDNVATHVTGSVTQLCDSAASTAASLGYQPIVLTPFLTCIAREAGHMLASIARYHSGAGRNLAFIAGGETVVQLTGKGLGGRNQELALAAAKGIGGLEDVCIFSVGSDGTDGPTDAAGGYVDGNTLAALEKLDIDIDGVLRDNDSYRALEKVGGLIVTGPTGTNVNDLCVLLIRAGQ